MPHRTLWRKIKLFGPPPRSPLQAVASLHHLSLGRQNATLGSFTGDGSGRFGLESCWGSAVSEPRSTGLLGAVSEQASESSLRTKWPLPRRLQAVASLHHLSLGRQNATLGSFTGDGSGRFGA